MIKMTKFLFVFSLLFLLGSCGNDDEADPTTNSLLGAWTAVAFTADVESTSTFNGSTTTSHSSIEGSNLNYDLTFTNTDFATNGSYDVAAVTSVDGSVVSSTNESYTNVSGTGPYSTSGNVITISESFFTVSVNGMPAAGSGQEQHANYEINSDGELVFSQNEEMTTTDSGVMVTTTSISNSTWKRK